MHLAIILAIFSAISLVDANKTDIYDVKQVVCPVYTKSLYESRNISMDIENFELKLCTILVVFDKYWHEATDPWAIEDSSRDSDYSQLTGLRNKFSHLKVLLGIRRNNQDYVNIAKNDVNRQNFAQHVKDFTTKYGFNGADLRWEYSSKGLNSGANSNGFLNLVKEVKEKFNGTDLLITSSYIVGNKSDINESDFPALVEASDFVAIFHGYLNVKDIFDAYKSRHSSLIETYFEDILKNRNSEASKILIGLPFKSPEFVLNPKSFLNRMIDYNTVCEIITKRNQSELDRDYKPIHLAYTLQYDPETKINSELVFECSRSIANKIRFSLRHGMGGAMISGLHHDDFSGKCGFEPDTWEDFKNNKVTFHIPKRNVANFTLLRSLNEAIEVSLDEIKQDPSHSTRNAISAMLLISGILAYLSVFM